MTVSAPDYLGLAVHTFRKEDTSDIGEHLLNNDNLWYE